MYKKYIGYIYETRPSTKHSRVKQKFQTFYFHPRRSVWKLCDAINIENYFENVTYFLKKCLHDIYLLIYLSI